MNNDEHAGEHFRRQKFCCRCRVQRVQLMCLTESNWGSAGSAFQKIQGIGICGCMYLRMKSAATSQGVSSLEGEGHSATELGLGLFHRSTVPLDLWDYSLVGPLGSYLLSLNDTITILILFVHRDLES